MAIKKKFSSHTRNGLRKAVEEWLRENQGKISVHAKYSGRLAVPYTYFVEYDENSRNIFSKLFSAILDHLTPQAPQRKRCDFRVIKAATASDSVERRRSPRGVKKVYKANVSFRPRIEYKVKGGD